MKLWMSGEIQSEAYDAYRRARAHIETTVNEALSGEEFVLAVEKIAYIAIIGAPAEYKEVAKYSKRTSVLEFRLIIPIEQFISAEVNGVRHEWHLLKLFRVTILKNVLLCNHPGFG